VYEAFVRHVVPRHPDAELRMVSDFAPPHPNVVLERAPDDATLAQRFRESWVFALGSTYEGFGIPYLESLASGTPVVATPNDGARDVIGDTGAALLVDDAAFGVTLADLLADRARRERLAAAGLARASQFSWREVALHHRGLYLDACGRAGLDSRPTERQ